MKVSRISAWLGVGVLLVGTVARGDSPSDMTFALTGDSIIARRLSTLRAPGVDAMWQTIREADVAFTNFETLVHDFTMPGEARSGGTYMGSPAYVLEELEWAGFDVVSLANNHTFDWGLEGMRQTVAALAKSKLVASGVGENLAFARAPAYFDTPKGRVALLSCASSFTPASVAGPQRSDIRGRPGLNPLRHELTYTVDAGTFATLQKLRLGVDMNEQAAAAKQMTYLDAIWTVGDEVGRSTRVNPQDLADMIAAVKNARQQSDWVMVAVHAHEAAIPGDRETPADFVVEFARAMIDAGADLVVGHGPHVMRGIEIYEGKPIFYSLANFIFENDLMPFQAPENYLKEGLGPDAQVSEYFSSRSKNDTVSFPSIQGYWESVYAEAVFAADRSLKEIRLHPVELGFRQPRIKRGQPYPASPDTGRRIIEGVARLSEPFGVAVAYENGVGIIRPGAQ